MSKKPILFNTEMVKAILDGRKTQTRRVVNKEYLGLADIDGNNIYVPREDGGYINILNTTWSKYKVGDILYVRESWCYGSVVGDSDDYGNEELWLEQLQEHEDNEMIFYKANMKDAIKEGVSFEDVKWKPSIHMPKKYARIFLKVVNVRVERLQDISKEDSLKEIGKGSWLCELANMYPHYEDYTRGFNDIDYDLQGKNVNGAICSFRTLWNSTTKKGYKWEDNPLVFVYEFERVEVC